MKVLIRVDASTVIGSGHVMRCLTLARALRHKGSAVTFASRLSVGNLCEVIASEFPLLRLPAKYADESIGSPIPWQADLSAISSGLLDGKFDWCVVDHYSLDERWEMGALLFSKRIMVIDDLVNRPHSAHVLLDQNLTATRPKYEKYLPANCRVLLGPVYALLRDEFSFPYERCFPERARRVLISFGGVDPGDETSKVLRALRGFCDFSIEVIAGISNPHIDSIFRLCAEENWQVVRHVNDIAKRMRNADLCIGAGGATSWERARLGLPTMCIAVAENQQRNAELMGECGAHLYLGVAARVKDGDIQEALLQLAKNRELRESLAYKSSMLVDGFGTSRVCQILMSNCVEDLDGRLCDDCPVSV